MRLHKAKEEYIWQGGTKPIYLIYKWGRQKKRCQVIGSDPELREKKNKKQASLQHCVL